MTNTPTSGAADLPEALRHAEGLESFAEHLPAYVFDSRPLKEAAATIRRLHALLEAEDAAHCNTIEKRDEAENLGAMLANAVAEHFRVEVGEYSNLNDPRIVALEILDGGYITDSDADRKIAALATGQATAAKAVVPTGFLHNVIALCTQRGYSPENIEAWSTDDKWIADLWRQAAQMLAAAPTQPATQQPQGAAYADAHGAIMGAAYDFRDAHISGSPNQKRSAHAALESAVTHTLRASHGRAPAQPATVHCKGRNCAAVGGDGHSDECASDHERAASGLDTAGNRNPVARYDGYRGAPCNPAYTKDQRAAWLEGYEARNRQGITPSPQADNKKKDPL